MTSKATKVLMRLREIDQKYKYKYDKKSKSDSDSIDNEKFNYGIVVTDEKNGINNDSFKINRPQLSIKIPDIHEQFLDTNSSEENENSVAVQVIDDNDRLSSLSLKTFVASAEDEKINSKLENTHDSIISKSIDLVTNAEGSNEEISISENLDISDDGSKSITDLSVKTKDSSDNAMDLKNTVESTQSRTEKSESAINIKSKESLSDKYSNDTFESDTSDKDKSVEEKTQSLSKAVSLLKPTSPSFYSTHTSKSLSVSSSLSSSVKISSSTLKQKNNDENFIKKIDVDIKEVSKIIKNENNDYNNTEVIKTLEIDSKLLPQGKVNDRIPEIDRDNVQVIIPPITNFSSNGVSFSESKTSVSVTNSHWDSSDEDKISQQESSEKFSPKSQTTMSTKNPEEMSDNNSIDSIAETVETKPSVNHDENNKNELNRYARKKRSNKKMSRTVKLQLNNERKNLERKMQQDCIKFRREHKRICSSMLHYLDKIKEERQQLHVSWSKNLVCPEIINKTQTIKPLDFPNLTNFIRPSDESINRHPDPNIEILRDRLMDIREWMKNQYLIYKEHCSMAAAINKTYNSELIYHE